MNLLKARLLVAVASILLFASVLAVGVAVAEDISDNGDCEQLDNGRVSGWGRYGSVADWGSLAEGYSGKGVYFVPGGFQPFASGVRKGENYTSGAILQGRSNGYTGPNALVNSPGPEAKYYRFPPATRYKIGFWVKSEASKLKVILRGWRTEEAASKDRTTTTVFPDIPRTEEWRHYEATVTPPPDMKRFAVQFQVDGFENDGLKLGRVCIDEVKIERVPPLDPESLKRMEIPAQPDVGVGGTLAAYRAGNEATIAGVKKMLAHADELAAKPDEWYRHFFSSFEPRGWVTVACPIHPFRTMMVTGFKWSTDEPWKLVCPLCKAEGRKYCYYPNPDYPDDGQGCVPTDEVWARDHDEAWSKAHRGIPHDHWDGSTDGYISSKRFYFIGACQLRALEQMQRKTAPLLGLAFHYASKLFPEGSEQHKRADLYAHKAQAIFLNLARAYFGDDYLAAAEGMSAEQFRARMEEFYRPSEGERWQYEKLAGFRPFTIYDVTLDDPVWEKEAKPDARGGYRVFIGNWERRGYWSNSTLIGYARVRASFSAPDDDIRRMCERVVVSLPGDREKVAMGQDPPAHYLKRGLVEGHVHPYNMTTGGDNQPGARQHPTLQAGMLLRDDAIIENVARDISYFWRNYFSSDGLGREGSPSYSAYSIVPVMDKLYGLKGDFDEDAPYFDKELGALNLFKLPEYQACALKMPYYATDDDDRYIPWEDSLYYWKRDTKQLERIEKYGGGIPDKERKYYHIERDENGEVTVTFNRSVPPPPVLLHDRRKAILRAGRPQLQTVVSLDWTKRTSHTQSAAQALTVHACGQDLASDLGYMGCSHFLTQKWISTIPAHNCLTLRKADGDPSITERLRGDLRRHFIVTPTCQVVDTAEYDLADWQDAGEQEVGEFSRQIVLMVPSEEHQYVIDIARGKGAAIHDYYLHCHGLGFETEGVSLKPRADEYRNLYKYRGWQFKCPDGHGAKNIKELATGIPRGPWQATWSKIDDYRDRPAGEPLIHDNVFMRLWMLDGRAGPEGRFYSSTEVMVGTAPAQRNIGNLDFGRRMKVVCVRRPGAGRLNKFIAVIEPYQDRPFVRSVRRLKLGTVDEYVVGLAIETIYGTDYVISYGGPAEPPEVRLTDGGHKIATDADFAMASFPKSGQVRLLVAGGSYLRADGHELKLEGPPVLRGRLLDFDDSADTLTVESSDPFPVGEELAGLPVIIQHEEDRSSFGISSVERLGDDRYLLRLDGRPHLMKNWLLVTEVSGSGITVEPPPALDLEPRNGYHVYGETAGGLRMLGPLLGTSGESIRDEWGAGLRGFRRVLTDDYSGVAPGQEIGITCLKKGHDTVLIHRFAYKAFGDN